MARKDELKNIKRKLRQLEKEIREIKEIIITYMSEPQRAILEFLGIGDREVLTKSGLGSEYVQIIKDLAKQTNEYAKEVLGTYVGKNKEG